MPAAQTLHCAGPARPQPLAGTELPKLPSPHSALCLQASETQVVLAQYRCMLWKRYCSDPSVWSRGLQEPARPSPLPLLSTIWPDRAMGKTRHKCLIELDNLVNTRVDKHFSLQVWEDCWSKLLSQLQRLKPLYAISWFWFYFKLILTLNQNLTAQIWLSTYIILCISVINSAFLVMCPSHDLVQCWFVLRVTSQWTSLPRRSIRRGWRWFVCALRVVRP